MVDSDNIVAVRTVEDVVEKKQPKGTKIGDTVLSTDADTLFPLQAALGYEITQTLFVGKHNLLVEGPSDLLYLKWFSNELKSQKRLALDPRWVIAPSGGIDKIGSFITLFGGNKLHVAVLTDYHEGDKRKVRTLRESEILKKGHVFSADMFADHDEADIEDRLGRSMYVALVNECYELKDTQRIPDKKPANVTKRVIVEVENHFKTLLGDVPEFDHYRPASFLLESAGTLKKKLLGLDQALERFEKFFKELNQLL
jgi:predicted ATP-dependent endonuclease of OLD family